jgi:hypothetical protein
MGYPQRLWTDEVAEFTRAAVRDFGPASAAEARIFMRALSKLAMHCVHEKFYPLDRNAVLDLRTIRAYCREKQKGDEPEAGHERHLKRLSAELTDFNPNDFRRGAHRTQKTFLPYDRYREIRIRTQGPGRSTARRRHNWLTFAALGGGFGLTGPESTQVKPDDITDHGDHLSIAVGGRRPRTVICRASWESDLRAVLSDPLRTEWLVQTATEAAMPAYRVSQYLAEISSWDESFSVDRLRSTFIVRHLEAGTSPLHLLEMAGLETFSALDRLRPYATARPLTEIAHHLRLDGRNG